MYTYFLSGEQLSALIANAKWFEGYWVRSKNIGPNRYKVTTNYNYTVPKE